ncbi:MAG TPA: thioredoxin [Pseudolabrys sp.]|jgi:thioredoxin-related protein|nr:thioredoxin [Pseudolabrys sp.]
MSKSLSLKFLSSAIVIGATFILAANARAAQLVMFEQAGCEWCAAFDKQIAPIYAKTEEGLRAPLRRVDIDRPVPPDLAFVQIERITPLFVLVDKGREIGRIRGYPGPESFWTQLSMLFDNLNAVGTAGERTQVFEKQFHAFD